MATKKSTPAPKPKTVLVVPLAQAKEKVFRQLDKGNEISKMEMRNEEEYKQVKAKHRIWSDYTEQLLKQIFNTDEMARKFSGFFGVSFGGGEPPLHKRIELFRDDILRDLERLASIYEQLELFPVVPTGTLPNEELSDQPYKGSASVTIHNYGTIYNPQIRQGSQRSSQTITSVSVSDDIKGLLEQLVQEVEKISVGLPAETARQVKQDLNVLSEEAKSETPRKEWLQLSAEGLKKAATDVGEIGKPVLELVARIVPLLLAITKTQ